MSTVVLDQDHEQFLRSAMQFTAVIVTGKQVLILRELERHGFVACVPPLPTERLPRKIGGHEYRVEITQMGREHTWYSGKEA